MRKKKTITQAEAKRAELKAEIDSLFEDDNDFTTYDRKRIRRHNDNELINIMFSDRSAALQQQALSSAQLQALASAQQQSTMQNQAAQMQAMQSQYGLLGQAGGSGLGSLLGGLQ